MICPAMQPHQHAHLLALLGEALDLLDLLGASVPAAQICGVIEQLQGVPHDVCVH
ncbi:MULTISPECIES: hypothetical protein [unclassified Sphingomonas]|jgi:hypothetical protein|uniref:hypothetical protein n=1 Tax=unclassified Sphingomonas TaxID=196159 RepID=UPI0013007301|nr:MULTISPECIES: hypothetical protein [unclassified Sphingomonas]